MYYPTYKIIVFGDKGVGKSSLMEGYTTHLSDSTLNIGVDFCLKTLIVDDKKVKLQVWVFRVGERFRFLLSTYVKAAKGGIFMYDITNYSSLAHIDDWLTLIKKEIDKLFPIIVVGNKGDLSEEREVSSEEGINIAKSRDLDAFIECSCKTGENVEEVFKTLTRLMLQRWGIILN